MTGTTLGPYKIIEQLGAGGMGEVYLGEDTRLGRKVAIKVLPEEYASDPERLARFEQEARAAAALNHPHIAVVHDVGSETSDDGTITHFMVQEYLEGQSLRERLEKGALPLDKALDLATEVGEALIAAHKAGIIHRDLKPDNIFVTEEGHAKVLDFGLAKLTEMAAPTGTSASMSPTMLGTVAGQVMGTAGYMAPEQINGEEIDHRADLFAFGAVFYEMVTGRRAFVGDNIHETLSRIISKQPAPLHEARDDLPAKLGWIIDKALAKDVSRRYQSAAGISGDLAQLQDDIAAGVAVPVGDGQPVAASVVVETPPANPWKLTVPIAIATLLIGALGTWWAMRPSPPEPEPLRRFEIELPNDINFSRTGRHIVAVSPDGARIAFTGNNQLWIRSLDDFDATRLRSTDDPTSPFFSPDGQQLGFFSIPDGQIKRVAVTGGAPISLAAATNPYGASWAEDGMIYYGQGPEGIWRVSENGGDPENVISIDSGQLAHGPQLLPGGEWVLFTEATGSAWNDGSIVAESLATGNRVVLIQGGTEGRYVPTGHIVYVRDGTLFAVPFDLGAMEVTSGPASMVEGVRTAAANFTGAANYALTSGGGLVYVQGAAGGTAVTLVWVNRESNVEPLSFEPRGYLRPRISPEEDRIAVQIVDAEGTHIWILDIETSTSQRLTFEGTNQYPVWAPDGEWVYFDSDRGGDSDIWKRRTDLSADAEPVYQAEGLQYPYSISGDGTVRLFGDQGAGNWDIQMLPLDGDSEPTMPENTDAETLYPWISPDGRWLAFQSNETGSLRIHVREIETGRRRTISTGFGTYPVWSRDGTEIIYRPGGGQRSVVEVTREPELSFSAPRPLFEVAGFQVQNDVSADGQRFLGVLPAGTVETAGESASPRINVVLNWFEELKQRVPTGREQ